MYFLCASNHRYTRKMKEKIFKSLKQEFSSLGLGDEILMSHADALSKLGLVTDANLDTVVKAQKDFLEGLQKFNDKRATEAAATARENAKKEFEAETKKKEEEAKKAAEAAKKAAEEAEAKKKAEEAEAAKKAAEEEAERKRLEELKKNTEVPEWYKKAQEEAAQRAKDEREAAEKRAADAKAEADKQREEFMKTMKELTEQNKTLTESLSTMQKENEAAKAAEAARKREAFILSKAKEYGIPQTRIDEGFAIAGDLDEKGITEYLGKVAANHKASLLPQNQHFAFDQNGQVDKAEMDKLAASMVK